MATILTDKNGCRSVQVYVGRQRKTIGLGHVTMSMARSFGTHVDYLASAVAMGVAPPPATAEWVGKLSDEFAERLADRGLIEPRTKPEPEPAALLGEFLDQHVAKRNDVKPATLEVWSQTVRNLKEHFGADRDLATITEGDADDFKTYLSGSTAAKREGETLAATTIAKRLQFARGFFRAAVRRRLIAANPFAEVSAPATAQHFDKRYVTREETDRLLEAADPTWQTIIALARYAGLRCPSEVLSLEWSGIDWQRRRIRVASPKTARVGKASREIPLFAELAPYLDAAWERADKGAVYVVDSRYRDKADTPGGWRNCNMRTQFERIVKRAGLEPWGKLFHALRSSRETELAAEFPIHVVTRWLGNTPRIALRHYLGATDNDFDRAAGGQHSAATGAAVGQHMARGSAATNCPSSYAAGDAQNRTKPHKQAATAFPGDTCATPAENVRERATGGERNKSGEDRKRTTAEFSGETEGCEVSAATGAAVPDSVAVEAAPLDPDLRRVVEAWGSLPAAARQAILAIVKES